ncbi:MAG TPA: DUF1186 domain-containing protein [Terriglobia bacterium]
MEISEILDRIHRATGRFEREAVEAAMERKKEIAPELLEILRKSLLTLENAPEMWAQVDPLADYTAHLYSIYLLGQFREPRAHGLLTRFGMLPAKFLEPLSGDFIMCEFARALAYTATDTKAIQLLVENRDASMVARIAALESIPYLVGFGRLDRAAAILYFRELFNKKLERKRSGLWEFLFCFAGELCAAELLPEARRALHDGLLSSESDLEVIENSLGEEWEGFGRPLLLMRSRPKSLDITAGDGWWRRRSRYAV